MGKQIHSLSEILNQRRDLVAPYFGNEVMFAYNPGAFDDDLMEGIQSGEEADLVAAVMNVIGDDEELATQIVEAIREAMSKQNASAYILNALKRVVVSLELTDEDGKPMSKDEALEKSPIPLRGSLFTVMTEDMTEGQKKSTRTVPKRRGSKQLQSSFGASS